jgi:aliphatic nitrilase
MPTKYKIAAAQLAPVYLDARRTVEKAITAIAQAKAAGASLIAFPEAFTPGFPLWPAVVAPIRGEELYCLYHEQSLDIDGELMMAVRGAAQQHRLMVSFGFSERSPHSSGGMWNSNVLISDDGEILVHHRKIVPTFYEKLIWTAGDGAGLVVASTDLGKIGALICGENVNPLARFALIAKGEQLHVSSWPPLWPTKHPDQGMGMDLRVGMRARAMTHSAESKAFTIAVAAHYDGSYPSALAGLTADELRILETTPRGVSIVIDPWGKVIAEAEPGQEMLLYADIDLASCVGPKAIQDLSGSYNRFDIFRLSVDRTRVAPLRNE